MEPMIPWNFVDLLPRVSFISITALFATLEVLITVTNTFTVVYVYVLFLLLFSEILIVMYNLLFVHTHPKVLYLCCIFLFFPKLLSLWQSISLFYWLLQGMVEYELKRGVTAALLMPKEFEIMIGTE